MKARLDSLTEIESACWRELGLAARDRDHAWRVLVLATVDSERADARSIIVREVDQPARTIVFYTDHRSRKVAQMIEQPQATMVGWSPQLSWQVRLRVMLEVTDSGLGVSSRWATVKLSPSAQDYLAALPPGTPVQEYQPERATRDHFAVVTATVHEIDWLELHTDGHRRARFDAQGGRWLVP